MRGARFADREYEKQGLFELPKPPTTPPVCGPGATTTPGGLLSDMREAFLAIPGMDAMKVELIVNTDMHLLEAFLGVSTQATFPERYINGIVEAYGGLLVQRGGADVDMAKVELAVQIKRDEMLGRWLEFECSDAGRKALARPGCSIFASNSSHPSTSPLSPAGPAAGGGGEHFQPAGKKKGKAKQQGPAPPTRQEAKESSEGDPDILFGASDGVLEFTKARPENLGRLLDATLSDDVSAASIFQTLDVNQLTIEKASVTEDQAYALIKWYGTANPLVGRVVREADLMNIAAIAKHKKTSELQRLLGVFSRSRIALQKAFDSIVLIDDMIARKETAKLAFLKFGNNAANFEQLEPEFTKAMKSYVAEGGDEPADDGHRANAFLRSLTQSPRARWRKLAALYNSEQHKERKALAVQKAVATAAGAPLPTSTPNTLALLLEKLAIEHHGMAPEPDDKAKPQPKTPRAQKQKGAAEDDGEDDGPSAAANAVVPTGGTIVTCIKCSGDHHIKALQPNGEPYHTPDEINKFYADRKAAKLNKASAIPAPAQPQNGGKGKQSGGQSGKGAKGKGKGQGKGQSKDHGAGQGKGKGKGYSEPWQDPASYWDTSGKGKGRGGGGWREHTEQWSDYGKSKGKGKGYPIAAAARQAEHTRHIGHLEAQLHAARAAAQADRELAESESAASSGGASPDSSWHEGYWGDDGYWYSHHSASHGGKSPRA